MSLSNKTSDIIMFTELKFSQEKCHQSEFFVLDWNHMKWSITVHTTFLMYFTEYLTLLQDYSKCFNVNYNMIFLEYKWYEFVVWK